MRVKRTKIETGVSLFLDGLVFLVSVFVALLLCFLAIFLLRCCHLFLSTL